MANKRREKVLKVVEVLLPVQLTDEELQQRGEALAGQHHELAQAETELSKHKLTFKAKEETISAEMGRLVAQLRSKQEWRPVECQDLADFDAGQVKRVRTDTGEVVSVRPVDPQERQDELPIPRGSKPELVPTPAPGKRPLVEDIVDEDAPESAS